MNNIFLSTVLCTDKLVHDLISSSENLHHAKCVVYDSIHALISFLIIFQNVARFFLFDCINDCFSNESSFFGHYFYCVLR